MIFKSKEEKNKSGEERKEKAEDKKEKPAEIPKETPKKSEKKEEEHKESMKPQQTTIEDEEDSSWIGKIEVQYVDDGEVVLSFESMCEILIMSPDIKKKELITTVLESREST